MARSAARRKPVSAAPLPGTPETPPLGESPTPVDDGPPLEALEAADVEEQADGSAVIKLPAEPKKGGPAEFHANLAEFLDETELGEISRDLTEKIKRDREARKKRDDQYAEGLKRTGLGNEAPGGAQFTGASKAVHPMLSEASVDFEAASIKELFPPEGPVKPKIEGKITPKKLELADRQQSNLNWQLKTKVPEFIGELERVLTQLPMGGSQYMKFWHDDECDWWTCEVVYVDHLLIPFSCSDFWRASRITHEQHLTEAIIEDRIDSKMYRDTGGLLGHVGTPEPTAAAEATDKIEGRERVEPNVDNERIVFETNTKYKISLDGKQKLPYLISIDDFSGKVLSIYRNWEEDDVRKKRLHWIVDWTFIPWRGAYGIGLPHLIGGLSAAATGALRALLDSAHVNNIPGGLFLKGWGISGQTTQPQATQFTEVQSSNLITDDIRKIAMPFPFNPPSTALFQLLGWLTDTAKGVVTTAEEKISEATNQMPVGTALALLEAGAKVFSAIHKRLHRSLDRSLEIIRRLSAANDEFENQQLEDLGEILATRDDFKKSLAVQPSSDPEIFSDGQRMAQAQILEAQATKLPTVYNMYEVQKRVLTVARIPDIDQVLPPPAKPTPLNAAAENVAAMTGKPLVAFPEQAHLAHLMTHLLFISDPILGQGAAQGGPFIANLAEHLRQHVGFQYVTLVRQIASESVGRPLEELMKEAIENPALNPQIDQLVAQASPRAQAMLGKMLAPIQPTLQEIYKRAEAFKQASQIPHPDAVAAATLVDDAGRKATESAAVIDLKQQKQDTDKVQKDRELDIKETQVLGKLRLDQEKADNEEDRNDIEMLNQQAQPDVPDFKGE